MKNFLRTHGATLSAVASSAVVASLISGIGVLVNCQQLEEARRSAQAAEQATEAARVEVAASKRRDRATAAAAILSAYQGVLAVAARDCVLLSWLDQQCKKPGVLTLTDPERDLWLVELLMWMELVYVTTDGLEPDEARAWREEALSYFEHAEICRRAKARLERNELHWEYIFWSAVPAQCRGEASAISDESAAKAVLRPSSAQLIQELKARLTVPDEPDDASHRSTPR